MIDKWLKTILAIIALFIFLLLGNPQARAENPLGLGAGIGFLADTANDTVFTMSFQGDYSVPWGSRLCLCRHGSRTN